MTKLFRQNDRSRATTLIRESACLVDKPYEWVANLLAVKAITQPGTYILVWQHYVYNKVDPEERILVFDIGEQAPPPLAILDEDGIPEEVDRRAILSV
jgi:hypothetical protein